MKTNKKILLFLFAFCFNGCAKYSPTLLINKKEANYPVAHNIKIYNESRIFGSIISSTRETYILHSIEIYLELDYDLNINKIDIINSFDYSNTTIFSDINGEEPTEIYRTDLGQTFYNTYEVGQEDHFPIYDYVDIGTEYFAVVNNDLDEITIYENFLFYNDIYETTEMNFTIPSEILAPFVDYNIAYYQDNTLSVNLEELVVIDSYVSDYFNRGFESGKQAGYLLGLQACQNGGFSFEWLTEIFNSAVAILNLELIPYLKLSYMIGIPLAFKLVKGLIKLWR